MILSNTKIEEVIDTGAIKVKRYDEEKEDLVPVPTEDLEFDTTICMSKSRQPTKVAAEKAHARNQLVGQHRTKNRTLSLDLDAYEKLQGVCTDKKWTVSRIVNDLILSFLEEVSRGQKSQESGGGVQNDLSERQY